MKVLFSSCLLVIAFITANMSALAQKETSAGVSVERDIDLLRRDLRAEKKKIIESSLLLTEAEAAKFWPVYDQYIADITKVYDPFYAVVKEWAANQKTVTDADASKMMKRWGELLVQIAQTRQRYIPIVEKVIPARKAAVFFHMDRRLYSLLELQVVTEMPVVAVQSP